jgi:protein-disulfide isomerase
MLPTETVRHHRIKKIIIGIIIIPIALFLMLLIVGFVANVFNRSQLISEGNFTANSQTAQEQNPSEYSGTQKQLIEGQDNPSFGAENPKLTIVQFADFQCPFCKASFPALRQLSLQYKDSVKVIFRDWPAHEHSVQLALGAYCAGEQNKFWEMHDKLYQNQSDTFGSNKNDLASLASEIGIYNEQFRSCFDSQKYLSQIQKNYADSQTLGVKGTPTWFFNGKKVEGAISTTDLETVIQSYVSN